MSHLYKSCHQDKILHLDKMSELGIPLDTFGLKKINIKCHTLTIQSISHSENNSLIIQYMVFFVFKFIKIKENMLMLNCKVQYTCVQSTILLHTLKYCAVIKHHNKMWPILYRYPQNPPWRF